MSEKTIEGVKVVPLRRIPDERGTIFHMLKATDPHFSKFGEIYFSTIYPGVVKGWHRHKNMTLHYACISGRVKLVIYDEREGSSTKGELMELFLGKARQRCVRLREHCVEGLDLAGEPAGVCRHESTKLRPEVRDSSIDRPDVGVTIRAMHRDLAPALFSCSQRALQRDRRLTV